MSFSNSNSESFGVKNNLQTYGNSLIQKNRLKNLDPNTVRIGLIDPNIAQTWAERVLSDGTTVMSIKKGDTINHTTSQPIATGLFCQRIFGPCTDYTCACGHEKIRVHLNVNVSNPVCPECHVEWTESSVRRQRLGSISLLSPVTHKWFSDSRNYIPILTGITVKTFRTLKECKLFFPFPFQKDYTSSSLFPSGSPSILPLKKGNNTLHIRATKNLQFLLESNVGQKTQGSRGRTLEGYKAHGPYPKAYLTKHLTRRSTPLIATELIESTGQPVDKLKNTIGQQDQKPLEPLVQQFALEQDQRHHRPLVPNSLKGQRAFGFKSSLMEPKEKQRMPKTQEVVTLKAKVSEIKTHSTPMENSQGLALHFRRGQTQKNRIFFKKVSNGSKPVVSKANNDQLTYKKILKQNLKTKLFNYLNNNCLNIKNILFNWSIFVSEGCILDNKGHELLVRSITATNKAHEEKVIGPLVHFKQQKNLSKKIKKPEFNLNENFLSFLSQKGKFINREVEILGLDYQKSQNLYFSIATAEILKQKNCTKLVSSLSTRKGSHKTKALSKQLNHNQSFGYLKDKSISNKVSFLANGVFAGGLSLPLTRVAKRTPNTLSGTSSADFTGLGSKDTFSGSTSFSKGPNILTLSPPNAILAKHQKQEESTRFLRSSLALEIYKKFGLNSNLIIKESLKFYDFSLNLEIIAWTIKKRLYCAKKLRTLSNLWSTRNEIDFNDNCYNKNIQKVNNLVIENKYSSPLPFVTHISQKKVIQNFCYNTTNLNRKLLFNNLLPFNKKSEKIEFGTLLATLVLDQSRYGEGSSPPLWYTAQRVNYDQPMPLKQHKVDKGYLEEKKNKSNNVFVTEKLFSYTSSTVGNLGPLDQKQVINTNTGFSLKASESPKAKSVGRDKGVSSGKESTGLWPKQELKSIQKEKKKNNKRKVALRSCFNLATCSTMPQMLPSYGRLQTVSKPKEVKAWSKGLSPQVPKELPKGQVGMGAPTIVLTPQETSFGHGTAFGRFGPVKDKTSKGLSLREQTKGISYDSNFEKKRFILEKHSPKKWTKVVLNKELSFWISFSSKKYKTKAITLAKLKFKSAKTKGFISNYNSLLVCSSVERDKTFYTSSFLSSARFCPVELRQLKLGQLGLSRSEIDLLPANKLSLNEKTRLTSPLGYNSCPIRPSFTQPEDYRRQFLKFIGNTGLIQPKDIPINLFDNQTSSFLFQIKNKKPSKALAKLHRQSQPLDYISIERDTGFALLLRHAPHYQDSLTWHLEQEPLPMTLGSPGPNKLLFKQTRTSTLQKNKGVQELYFSESNWIAKEEKVKKILSQTGGGGLQKYLGLINVGQLVFILQNDLFEIAPRLARSQSARRILLQIVNETYNNLSQFILLLEKIQKNSLKKNNLKETLGFWSKGALGQNLDLTSKYAKVTTPKKDRSKASKDTLSRHVKGLTHAHRAKGLPLAKTTSKPRDTNFLDSSTNPLLEEFPEQIDKIKQIIKNKIENLEKKYKEVKKEYKTVKKICTDFQNRKNAHKRRYKLAFQLFRTTSNPAGMTLSSIPVLPPGLRPIIDVPKIGPITADLNIRYRGLIFALRNLRELAYVDFRNAGAAQASVQEAVDDLLYTGGKTRKDKGVGLSPPNLYKSLAMRLKGKHGRFRGNLLGKRVDYSGRSVIVVGPTLKIHQCGLPFEIALKLFNPFLIRRLIQKGLCKNVYKAKQILIGGKFKPLIWALCREVMLEHLVLLNRAPTLHRLGVQAFIPILISGRAILLHPLVCTGFNADFDGDQMGVHVPLFPKARAEAWKMMWSRNNFLSPSSGEPILLPSQDMVLGCYYLTEMYSEKLQSNTRRSLKKNLEVTNFAALLKKGRSLAPCPKARPFGASPLGKGHNLLNIPKSLQSFSLVSTHFGINKKEKDLNFDFRIRKTTLKLALVTISKSLFSDFSLFQSLKNYKPRYIGEFFTFLKEPDFKIKTSTVLPIKYAGLKVSSSYSKRALAKGLVPKGRALGQDQRAVQAFGLLPTVCYLRQPLGQTGRKLRPLSQGHRTWRQSPKAMLCNRDIGLNFITLPEGSRIRAALRKNQQTYCYPRNGFKAARLWSCPKGACPKGPCPKGAWGKATPFSQRDLLPLACYAKYPFSTKNQLAHSLLGKRYGNRDSSLIGNKDPKASFVYTQLIGSFWPLVYKSVFLNWTGYSSLTPSLKLLKNRGFGTIYEIKKQEEIHDKNLVPISEGLSKKLDLNNNENALSSHWSFGAALEFSSPWFVAQKAYPLKYNKSQKTKLCEKVFCGAALGPKAFARSKAFGSLEHIQNLSAKIVVDRYYRGFYNLQSIVWVSLNLKKDLATNYFPEKTKNLENEGFLTPTLELRISPYGITHLLQISGSKKSLFYNSLLVPTKKTVKTPFEFSSIRTTVGRLLFNDILQKFEISLKGSS